MKIRSIRKMLGLRVKVHTQTKGVLEGQLISAKTIKVGILTDDNRRRWISKYIIEKVEATE